MKPIYLVAYYFQKPAHERVRTQRPGWMQQPNSVSWDEQVTITKNLKNKDLTMSKIIIDLANRRVVRNSWNSAVDFDELFVYFCNNYRDQCKSIMTQLDPDYWNKMFPEVHPTLDAAPLSAPQGILETVPLSTYNVSNDEVRVIDTSTRS